MSKKEKVNPWETIDQKVVESLTNEFKALHVLYVSQEVDALAIASAFFSCRTVGNEQRIRFKRYTRFAKVIGKL